MKKRILKTVLPAAFICLCFISFVYPVMAKLPPKAKIGFAWAPGGIAWYGAPPGKGFDGIYVWAAYMVGSTYGRFILVLVEYYKTVGGVTYYTDIWYTTDLRAGKAYAALTVKAYTDATDVYSFYNVTKTKITTNQPSTQPDYLSVTVTSRKVTFTIQYTADTGQPIQSALVSGAVSQTLFLGVKAFRPLASAVVTGLTVGGLQGGQFRYLQDEMYDQSLLS